MLRIIPCSLYKDCTTQDFNHYFAETFLVFHLTDTKTRIFIPETVDGAIYGQYLTRLKVWKPLTLKWDEWWKRVSLIAPFPISFNLGSGAVLWSPNISKQGPGASGYRKSFPSATNKNLHFYGKFKAEDKQQQNLVYTAFSSVYKDYQKVLTLAEEVKTDRTASVCKGDFMVSRQHKQVFYKGSPVAEYNDGKIVLPKALEHLADFMLLKAGASVKQIQIQ